MKFDDIIAEIGEFGPYQKRRYYLVCLIAIPSAIQTLGGVFTMATPDHRDLNHLKEKMREAAESVAAKMLQKEWRELEDDYSSYYEMVVVTWSSTPEDQRKFYHGKRCTLPYLPNDTYKSQGAWHDALVKQSRPWDEEEQDFSYCKLFRKNFTSGELFNDSYTCSSWVFSDEFFESTFTTEIDMICDDKSLSTYLNMIYMGGLLAGSFFLGALSDVIGRKKVMLIGIAVHFSSSFALAFITSYVPFAILRFTNGCFGMGMFLAAFVIGMEIVGPSKRKIAGIVIELVWSSGLFLLALLAYLIRDWKYLQIATSIPTVFLLSFAFLMPESPRWLISKGRYKEAAKIIQEAAKKNGVKFPDHLPNLDKLEKEEPVEKIWGMFKSPVLLIRCLVIFYNWLVASLVYYGLSLNVGALSGNIYLNFTLFAIVETASYFFCLLLLDRLGRKPLQCFSMLLAGIACLCIMFPVMYGRDSFEWITITLSLVGKFGASASFAIIFVFSAELFPTTMRNSGMGLSSFSARIGGIISPYIADLSKVVTGDMGVALPLIIFGGTSVLAGLLVLLLPETVGKVLPETVADAKNFGKKSKKNAYELNHKTENGNKKLGSINAAYTPDV